MIRGHPRPWRLIAARLLQDLRLSPLLTIRQDGYRLRFYPTNVSAVLWINRGERIHGLELFRDYCRAGETAIDVGANIGEVSIILSQRVGADGRVMAFEPQPRIFEYLRGNLALNHCANVTTRNLALAAVAGTVHMTDTKWDDMNRVHDGPGIAVPASTLDAEVDGDGPIALLKVDVEGSELRVLEGGAKVLARTQCINCEMGEGHYRRYGYGMADMIGFLQRAGFETFVIAPGPALRPIGRSFADAGGHELVAVRNPSEFVSRTGWRVL